MRFEFATANRIVFGPGSAGELGRLLKEQWAADRKPNPSASSAPSALVVTGRDVTRVQPVMDTICGAGFEVCTFAVSGEPSIDLVQQGVETARQNECCWVVGIGGGSAIDAGKAIAALAENPGDLLDYLELVGRGKSLTEPGLPYAAVPTTAGAGAEVTRNAVIVSPEHRVKVSLRSAHLLPRLAVVDPELTYSLAPSVTAATGLDALTQLIEPFVSGRANPMTDGICREGIARVARSLRRACERGEDAGAREDMSMAALFGGVALANAGLGAVHGFAGPIGGEFAAPHGAICAALLPRVMAANVQAMREREPGHAALARYGEIARIVTGRADADIDDGLDWTRQLAVDLHIPPLGDYGIEASHTDALVDKAMAASSMKGNPIALTRDELRRMLIEAL